jgi:hypothetical protein
VQQRPAHPSGHSYGLSIHLIFSIFASPRLSSLLCLTRVTSRHMETAILGITQARGSLAGPYCQKSLDVHGESSSSDLLNLESPCPQTDATPLSDN